MKKTTPELQRLIWVIDFVNLDIDKLEWPDFIKVFIEMENKFDVWGEDFPLNENPQFWSEMKTTAKVTQERFRNVFDKIFEAKGYSEVTKREKRPRYRTLFQFKVDLGVSAGHGKIWVGKYEFDQALEYTIADLIYRCSPPESLFSEAHNLTNLKKCQAPGCQKYFWKVHKKEKNYCSNKCAWRAYSAFKREEEKKDRERKKEGN